MNVIIKESKRLSLHQKQIISIYFYIHPFIHHSKGIYSTMTKSIIPAWHREREGSCEQPDQYSGFLLPQTPSSESPHSNNHNHFLFLIIYHSFLPSFLPYHLFIHSFVHHSSFIPYLTVLCLVLLVISHQSRNQLTWRQKLLLNPGIDCLVRRRQQHLWGELVV